MGISGSKDSALDEATEKAAARLGRASVECRYHRLPKRLADDYNMEKKALGTGYNGQVLLARRKGSNQPVAVKAFKLNGISREKKAELVSEAEIFLSMDHPHVGRLLDCYESEDILSLVMECLEGGELFDRVSERKAFKEQDAANAAKQMLLAVNYIHSHGIVHRDIKLENFLYEAKDTDFLKLIDFGFSKVWSKNTKMEVSCGTLSYVAPEVLAKSYDSQCDMWSFGVVVFILLVGYMPFSGAAESDQIRQIKAGTFTMKKPKWAKVSADGFDFVEKLIVVNPKVRLTPEQALQHPWIANLNAATADYVDVNIAESLKSYASKSKFRKACLQLMAWSLTTQERASVRDAFMQLDSSNTGKINLVQLKDILQDKFHMEEDETDKVFRALDQNCDEEIQYSEFLAAMMATRIKLHDGLLKETFRRFDYTGDGNISEKDLKEVLGPDANVKEIMAQVDKNHDGTISYEEFIGYLHDQHDENPGNDAVLDSIDRELNSKSSLGDDEEEAPRLRKRDVIQGLVGKLIGSN